MTGTRVYISGMGVISSLGAGISATRSALQKGKTGIGHLSLFQVSASPPLPVGEVTVPIPKGSIPRTHQFAMMASDQAMKDCKRPPDAIVLGTTTGGMLTSEGHLKAKALGPDGFRYHGLGSVAEVLARRYHCSGPLITVSTACSSGAVAVKIAREMLRAGLAEQVLAVGADSLCRLTYYGFNSLQLIDPEGARPLDKLRRGMSVAEGAAAMLLVKEPPENAAAEVLGVGLSCDAYHAASPHPDGLGALAAMRSALDDAGITATDIDYVNLHGTGTVDNDLSEARAIKKLFKPHLPLLSSVKGAFGHSLAAAGAIEAVVSALCVAGGWLPANTGCRTPDPDLGLAPLAATLKTPVENVLSNSLGFGGNNAAVVIGSPRRAGTANVSSLKKPLSIYGHACLTGAGDTRTTKTALTDGKPCKGPLMSEMLDRKLPSRTLRRLKRLPRLALSLALAAGVSSGRGASPSAVFWGTGWGAQTETADFLNRLFETDEKFPSPTDFIASVHNAPAGQVAMYYEATGPNVTTSGGDYSFEQALLAAQLLTPDTSGSVLLIGADESHGVLTPLCDRSHLTDSIPAEGGGAFWLSAIDEPEVPAIDLVFYRNATEDSDAVTRLIDRLGGPVRIQSRFGGILCGIPGAERNTGERQLSLFLKLSEYTGSVVKYRQFIGEFASASAVAAVLAAEFVTDGKIPASLCRGGAALLNQKGLLVLGLGGFVTAMEVFKR